jgi:Bacterial protein of unknown function (DUF839)
MLARKCLIIGSVAFTHLMNVATMLAETATGPSSASPYVVNVPKNVDITAILTVGDSVNNKPDSVTPYRMVGIPDGLGAFDNYDGTFTVLMNHELPQTSGIERQHGFTGAFVSHWIVRKSDLTVLHGGDQAKQVLEWKDAKFVPAEQPIGRLCSADLAQPSAFYDRSSGKGYTGRIFMDGEEVGPKGRAFAHIVSGPGAGISYELPSLGKFSWENALASPYEQEKTVVVGTDDDSAPPQLGQVYVYVGEKQTTGNEVEKAGLHGGKLYGVRVVMGGSQPFEERETWITEGDFELQIIPPADSEFDDVREMTGEQIQAESVAKLVTEFRRPEDGAWDTRNPNVFYFVTTDRYDSTKDGSGGTQVARSRLHRLTFKDITNPQAGGRYDVLLDGTGPQQMLDNMTVDGDGNLILQEDPGNQAHLARIWKFYPRSGELVEIAKHDPARFGGRNGAIEIPATPPFNSDEESSGIIEITRLLRKNLQGSDGDRFDSRDDDELDERLKWVKRGYRYYLAVTQAHYLLGDPELVEGGQLFIMGVPRNVREAPHRSNIEDINSTQARAGQRP